MSKYPLFQEDSLILYFYCQAGHQVTVYERNDRIGGLLRYGIPTMKLGKDVSAYILCF